MLTSLIYFQESNYFSDTKQYLVHNPEVNKISENVSLYKEMLSHVTNMLLSCASASNNEAHCLKKGQVDHGNPQRFSATKYFYGFLNFCLPSSACTNLKTILLALHFEAHKHVTKQMLRAMPIENAFQVTWKTLECTIKNEEFESTGKCGELLNVRYLKKCINKALQVAWLISNHSPTKKNICWFSICQQIIPNFV